MSTNNMASFICSVVLSVQRRFMCLLQLIFWWCMPHAFQHFRCCNFQVNVNVQILSLLLVLLVFPICMDLMPHSIVRFLMLKPICMQILSPCVAFLMCFVSKSLMPCSIVCLTIFKPFLQKGSVLTSCYSVFPLQSLAALSVSPCSSPLVCKLSLSLVLL